METGWFLVFFYNCHGPNPTGTRFFDLYGETGDRESVGTSYGREIGHLFHVAVTDLDSGEMGLPDHFGISGSLELFGKKRKRSIPTPGIDTHNLDTLFCQK